MSTTAEAIRLVDKISQDGINRETATELIDYVESQRGDLATKQDMEALGQDMEVLGQANKQDIEALRQANKQDMEVLKQANKQDMEALRQANKQDMEVLRQANKQGLELIDQKLEWLKWIVGIGFAIGFTLLATFMIYLHSDTKAEMKELKAEMKEIKELLQRR